MPEGVDLGCGGVLRHEERGWVPAQACKEEDQHGHADKDEGCAEQAFGYELKHYLDSLS